MFKHSASFYFLKTIRLRLRTLQLNIELYIEMKKDDIWKKGAVKILKDNIDFSRPHYVIWCIIRHIRNNVFHDEDNKISLKFYIHKYFVAITFDIHTIRLRYITFILPYKDFNTSDFVAVIQFYL